jgi:hypothetical protein
VRDVQAPIHHAKQVQTEPWSWVRFVFSKSTASLTGMGPPGQVSVDIPWSPYGIDGRWYDWLGMAQAADLLFFMAYDMQAQVLLLPPPQHK